MNAGHCMCILLRLRKKAVMSIVKSAQLPNVGRCGGGLPMATFEKALSRMSGNLPVRFLWGLVR